MRLPFGPPAAPETPREVRARRALELLLGRAVAVSAAAGLASEARRPRGPPPAPLASLAVDLAHDPPWALRLLPGVGPARAAAVVADRERLGPLPSLEDLERVPGFGPKTVASLAAAGAVVRGE